MKTIILSLGAAKDLDALERDARDTIGRNGYRLRIGSYRVIFDEDQTTILVIYSGRRSSTTYRRN